MKRHSFDMTSFLFGIVLGAAAIGFLLAEQLSWDVDGRWVFPAALIILGIAGVAGAISGLRPGRGPDDAPPEEIDEHHDGSEEEGLASGSPDSTSDVRTP